MQALVRPLANGSTVTAETASEGSLNPLLTSDQALLQRQREILRLQDSALGDIEKGVDRLHTQVCGVVVVVVLPGLCLCYP
jgi:hypothetical protein